LASAAGELHRGGEVKLWDLATGHERRSWSAYPASVQAVAFSPDGQHLATASLDDTIQLWDVATGRRRDALRCQALGAHALAFAPDGQALASTGCDGTVKIWDLRGGRVRATRRGYGHLAFSPDGRTLAAQNCDGPGVKLWDATTMQERATLREVERAVLGVAF